MKNFMLYQFVSIAGALLILAAYVALQFGWMGRENKWFNILNLAGSALLTWVAFIDWRAGFILLEGAWAILSFVGLFRRSSGTVSA